MLAILFEQCFKRLAMKDSFKTLPLAWQINTFTCVAIVVLASVAGFVSVQQSSSALLDSEHKALQKNVETAAELISTPYQSLLPIVGSMAANLQREFSGTFDINVSQSVNVAGNSVPSMSMSGQLITNNFTKVDTFTEKWGAAATIFQRVDDDFLRVSTSLKKGDNSRAFGTWLGKNHPGYQTLMAGNPYIGYANLFGRHFITQYDPVMQSGSVVAILFVGVDVSETVNGAFNAIRNIKIGDTGYLFIVNSKGKVIMHPELGAGTDMVEVKAVDGSTPFATMVSEKEGDIRYLSDAPGGDTKERYLAYEYADDWRWIISGGTYEEEFTRAASSIAWLLTLIYVFGSVIVVLVGFWMVSRLIKPLNELANSVHIIGQGELVNHGLNSPVEDSKNEVHRIEVSMNNMVSSLRCLINDALSIGKEVKAKTCAVIPMSNNRPLCNYHKKRTWVPQQWKNCRCHLRKWRKT
jgi:methyl-accepting chemotaxis protein-2 (aspartate sensor receptor)